MGRFSETTTGVQDELIYVANLPEPDGRIHVYVLKLLGRLGSNDFNGNTQTLFDRVCVYACDILQNGWEA